MTESRPEKPVVLITGATGLIGMRISHRLKDEYQIVGMDLDSPNDEQTPGEHIDVDLTDDEKTRKALEQLKSKYGSRLASVIHLAAYYDFSGEPSPLYQELTVEGTRRLLTLLHEMQFEVEQFVFSSSLLVMKPSDSGKVVQEYSETEAEWAYPQSKLDAEEVIRQKHGDYPYVILRIAGVYDEQCHSLPVSQQIARIYEKQLEGYVFPGDSSHGQSLVHLDDLADCFRNVVERRSQLELREMFLIGEPDVMSYAELQDRLGELIHGTEWPTIRVPKFVAKAGAYVKQKMADEEDSQFIQPWMINLADDHYETDNQYAREKLDWQPRHRLRHTLPAMIDFLKSNPAGFYKANKLPIPKHVAAD